MTYTIAENICLIIGRHKVILNKFIDIFIDIVYYEASLVIDQGDNNFCLQSILFKIGKQGGFILNELEIRKEIRDYQLFSPLIFTESIQDVKIVYLAKEEYNYYVNSKACEEEDGNFLPEEYLTEDALEDFYDNATIIVTMSPLTDGNLYYLNRHKLSILKSINNTIQFCQIMRYLYQRKWSLFYINFKFVTFNTICNIYDLCGVVRSNTSSSITFSGSNCAPELGIPNQVIDEKSTVFIVGAMLYRHALGESIESNQSIVIPKIPFVNQFLYKTLHSSKDERPTLEQTLDLLFQARRLFTPKIYYDFDGMSVIGLSPDRLTNEDNFGIKSIFTGNFDNCVLAVVADGMGGMDLGGVASMEAVNTLLTLNMKETLKTDYDIQLHLNSYVKKANQRILQMSESTGTTITAILILDAKLFLSHIGDSRLYLIRNKMSCQLTTDHSIVSMLLANGKISNEEAKIHPERNILLRSLGSCPIDDNYIQTLNHWGSFSIKLMEGDVLIICTDGVWSYIDPEELVDFFADEKSLKEQVCRCINQVLERGASDNATVVAVRVLQTKVRLQYEDMSNLP